MNRLTRDESTLMQCQELVREADPQLLLVKRLTESLRIVRYWRERYLTAKIPINHTSPAGAEGQNIKMSMTYSPDFLNLLTPDELELTRDSGLQNRQILTDRVIAALNIPDGWSIVGEWQNEFGGLFPVQCRLTPDLNKPLTLSLCSPGDVSPMWVLVIQAHPAQRVRVLYAATEFYSDSLTDLLSQVDNLLHRGGSAQTIANALGEGSAW